MKLYIVFILIFLFNSCKCLQYRDCGSKVGKFTRVSISDCDTTQAACILKRNTKVKVEIDFVLAENVGDVKTVVHGKVLGVEIPFHMPNENACQDSGLKCPLLKDHTYEYSADFPIRPEYPRVAVEVKYELRDHNNDDIVCILIPARIH